MPGVPELEQLHRIVVTQYQAGSAHRWKACLAASCVVGKYDRGATLSLASDLCLSVSQVENLAHAGWGWRVFRKYFQGFGVASATRQRLTPSHFCVMFDLWREYEFSPWDAAETLVIAAEEGASVVTMRGWLDVHDTRPEWVKRLGRITPQVELLCNDYGVPEGVREAALNFINAVNNNGVQREENLSAGRGAAPLLE